MAIKIWIYVYVIFVTLWSPTCGQDVTYHMDEEQPNSTLIGNVAQDSDLFTAIGETDSSSLTYSFLTTNNQYAQYFRVDDQTSSLYTNATIDREAVCPYTDNCVLVLQIAAKSTLGSFFRILKVHIFINDINDHSPVFKNLSLTLPISEAELAGTSFAIEGAIDRDLSSAFSLKYYELESNDMLTESIPFSIEFVKTLDGRSVVNLFVTTPLDREKKDTYSLEIVAKDGDTPPRVGRLPVYIVVLDVNDNPPVFDSQSYNVTVTEETAAGSVIITLEATDADIEDNGRVTYQLSSHQSDEIFKQFEINGRTGEVTLKEQIVYSPGKVFRIIVVASDNPLDGQFKMAQAYVFVTVENSGNHAPNININMLTSTVSENANIGTVVAYVSVQDHDSGRQGRISCIITSIDFGLQRMMSSINDFKIYVAQKIDFERKPRQNITVHCQDDGLPPMQASSTFSVEIKDENDHSPVFTKPQYSENVPEDLKIGEFILDVSATDLDSGNNSEIYFKVSSEYKNHFYFESSTTRHNFGNLRLNKSLDRESKAAYIFPIYAVDKGSPEKTGTAVVKLYLTDVNDVKPNFTKSPFRFEILENLEADSEVGRVTATDNDLGKNRQIIYRMHPDYSNRRVPFVVLDNGAIKTNQELDRETQDLYEFKVIAVDRGDNPQSSTGSVMVIVSDANDWNPEIEFPHEGNNSVVLQPPLEAWHAVTKVIASDNDEFRTENSKLRFSINSRNDSGLFQINPNTGEIQITKKVDAKFVGKIFRLDISVSDSGKPTERTDISRLIIKFYTQNVTEQSASTNVLSNKNFLIAIIVGIVTVVLSVGILATIIIIRKIDRQRKEEQSNKNTENPDDIDSKQVFDGSITVFSLPSEDSLLEKKKKEVSFSLEDDVFSDDDLIQKNGYDHHHHRHFKPNLSYLSPGPKKIEDNHSETSGDTGTSDSGRGGSDEEIHTSMSQSPRDKMMDLSRQIPALAHQEIIPFSFKKGLSMPHHHSDFNKPNYAHSDLELRNKQNDIEMSRRDLDLHRSGLPASGMSTMAVHLHNDTLDRSRNKVVLLQTDSGIHSDTNSNEGDVCRDCMV